MNEKIKQLALDAGIGFTLWDDSGREMIDNYTPEEYLEKFAELIARDICKIVKGQKIAEPLGGYQDWENGYNASVKHAVEQIKRQYKESK